MSYNLGINVVEVDGRATPSIQAAPTSVAGFIICAQRGADGKVVQITNWSQFEENFGSYMADAYGAYAVRGFFDNGGSEAYVIRVVNKETGTGQAASLESKPGPWALKPDVPTTITHDGAKIEVIFKATNACLTGRKNLSDLSDKKLKLTVNGASQEYKFQAIDFQNSAKPTVEEIVSILGRRFKGIQVWVENAKLNVCTDRCGSSATLKAEDAAADIIFDVAETAGTGDVLDIDNVTLDQALQVFQKALAPQKLQITTDGQKIIICHSELGSGHTVVAEASDNAAVLGFTSKPGLDGSNAQPAIAATAVFDSAMTLKAGCRGYEDPGDWGNTLKIWVGNLKDSVFDLTVSKTIKDANGGEKKTELETWFSLSLKKAHPRYIVNILNDQYAGSKNVMVDPATVNDVLLTVQEKSMQGGKNGVFASPEALAKSCANAIDLFKLTNVQLMTCPETCDAENFLPTALAHCEEMGDRLYVGYTPIDRQATEADMNAFSGKLRGDKVYGALYFPWIRVRDPLGTQKWIPPVGHVLGVYARTDRERGVWKAPAGNAVKILGAVDVKHHITEVEHTKLVKNCGVNAIRFIPGQGIVVDSSRTLSTNPLWLYVNIRLLFNFVKSSLKTGLRWVVQEPNDETLWNKVKYNSVTPFLMGLWRRGAFGSGSPEDTFTVKIDRENNPEADVQQGILNVEVYFYPSRPAETIVIKVGQQEGGASASEG